MITQQQREDIVLAAVNCEHQIDADCIRLYRDPTKAGSALSQMVDRVVAAIEQGAQPGADGRALLAEQARTEPKAFTDDELRAEVKLRIERSGQTQEGYAKAHGYSPQYLSDFLTGKRLPGDKILQGEGLQAQTLYLDSMAVRVGVTGHNRFATRGDAGNLACKKCGAHGLFTQIHQRPDGSDCGYLAHIVFAAQPLKAEQAKDAEEDARMTTAARDVLAERQRQVSAEGWTPEHDDEHRSGDMACAAASYAAQAGICGSWPAGAYMASLPPLDDEEHGEMMWPWNREWWKPKNPRADLVRAGALILAEIERMDRAARAAERKA